MLWPAFFNDEETEPFGESGLVERDGKDQTAHDKHHHGMHIRRPGGFDVAYSHHDQRDPDDNGRDFERYRFNHEQKDQHDQNCQKSHGFGRKSVDIVEFDAVVFRFGYFMLKKAAFKLIGVGIFAGDRIFAAVRIRRR